MPATLLCAGSALAIRSLRAGGRIGWAIRLFGVFGAEPLTAESSGHAIFGASRGVSAIAVDGEDVVPFSGTTFELAIAQRIDLRVTIPRGTGAYPILAQGEGTDMLAGVVLATPGAPVPPLSPKARTTAGALTNAQEMRLRSARPLPARPIDRSLRVALNGRMADYVLVYFVTNRLALDAAVFTTVAGAGPDFAFRAGFRVLFGR